MVESLGRAGVGIWEESREGGGGGVGGGEGGPVRGVSDCNP